MGSLRRVEVQTASLLLISLILLIKYTNPITTQLYSHLCNIQVILTEWILQNIMP
jgi:hypothetical protein